MSLPKSAVIACRAFFSDLVLLLPSEPDQIDERLLRWLEKMFCHLEIFDDLVTFCEKRRRLGISEWVVDQRGAEEFIREALVKQPSPELMQQIISGGFVSLLPQLKKPANETKGFRQELLALLLDPERLMELHVEIFGQPTLPPAWKM